MYGTRLTGGDTGLDVAAAMPDAGLVDSRAKSHMIWFGSDYPRIAAKIRDFLAMG